MRVTVANYHRLAKLVGLLLTCMGIALTALFGTFVWTGANPLGGGGLDLDGVGLLILASIGAFALPLGVSLFSTDSATSARLRIAAYALGLMGLLRLAAFANPDIRAVVGLTPLFECVVLGGIGLVAFGVRPDNESPIELHMALEVDVPATDAWHVIAEQFGSIGQWAVAIQSSTLDRDVEVGAIRTCHIAGFGPIGQGKITEELIAYDSDAMTFTYTAKSGLPPMIRNAKNRWSVEEIDARRCRIRSHATMDLPWWALPMAGWIGWGMARGVPRFTEELRHRIETGTPHPRKLASIESA